MASVQPQDESLPPADLQTPEGGSPQDAKQRAESGVVSDFASVNVQQFLQDFYSVAGSSATGSQALRGIESPVVEIPSQPPQSLAPLSTGFVLGSGPDVSAIDAQVLDALPLAFAFGSGGITPDGPLTAGDCRWEFNIRTFYSWPNLRIFKKKTRSGKDTEVPTFTCTRKHYNTMLGTVMHAEHKFEYPDWGQDTKDYAKFRKYRKLFKSWTDFEIHHRPGSCCDSVAVTTSGWATGAITASRTGSSDVSISSLLESRFIGSKKNGPWMQDHAAVSLNYKKSQIELGTLGVQYSIFSIATPNIKWTIASDETAEHVGNDAAEPIIDAGNDFKLEFATKLAINLRAYGDSVISAGHKQYGGVWNRFHMHPRHCVDFECYGSKDGIRSPCWLGFKLRGDEITGQCSTCHGVQDVLLFSADSLKPLEDDYVAKDDSPWQGGKVFWKMKRENKSKGLNK